MSMAARFGPIASGESLTPPPSTPLLGFYEDGESPDSVIALGSSLSVTTQVMHSYTYGGPAGMPGTWASFAASSIPTSGGTLQGLRLLFSVGCPNQLFSQVSANQSSYTELAERAAALDPHAIIRPFWESDPGGVGSDSTAGAWGLSGYSAFNDSFAMVATTFRAVSPEFLIDFNIDGVYAATAFNDGHYYGSSWYPGDDYVDICGIDGYGSGTTAAQFTVSPPNNGGPETGGVVGFAVARGKRWSWDEWGLTGGSATATFISQAAAYMLGNVSPHPAAYSQCWFDADNSTFADWPGSTTAYTAAFS